MSPPRKVHWGREMVLKRSTAQRPAQMQYPGPGRAASSCPWQFKARAIVPRKPLEPMVLRGWGELGTAQNSHGISCPSKPAQREPISSIPSAAEHGAATAAATSHLRPLGRVRPSPAGTWAWATAVVLHPPMPAKKQPNPGRDQGPDGHWLL